MDIKNSAITAKMLIHSLLALLENENVDISSVKFKVGSDGNGYESPEFELEKLVSLAIDGLVEIEDAGAVPEGFVLVPKAGAHILAMILLVMVLNTTTHWTKLKKKPRQALIGIVIK